MKKTRILHKDGDNTAITMIYYFSIFLKKHRALWDSSEDVFLNRFYKGVLTKTIKVCDKVVNKYRKNINHSSEKEVIKVLDDEFAAFKYEEQGDNLELLKTMFCAIILLDSVVAHKRNMIGVILKSMISDVVKAFSDFKRMWIREIDDNAIFRSLNND